MIKREALFGRQFRAWLKDKNFPPAAFELKQTTRNTFPFKYVKEHQINALLAASRAEGILYKAPDDSRGVKPFDFFYLRHAKAYVVIKYPRGFVLVTIKNFVEEAEVSIRGSMSYERALAICDFHS
jgi:hypothetical protein